MPLPAILDVAQTHLFTDADKMQAAGLPAATIRHILRLRDAYDFWLAHPSKKDREIIDRLRNSGGISRTQAYDDLHILKHLLGALQKASKDYHTYRFIEMITSAYEKAAIAGDAKAMAAAAATYAKFLKLDKDDDSERRFDIVPQQFKFTDDPSVINIKRMPNKRERIEALKQKYWNDDVRDVDFEEIDLPDEIFNPKPKADDSAGLPE